VNEHESFMRLALRNARKGLGHTSPNPPVGAVVVRDGRVVGEGHHERAGGPHAEAIALAQAGEAARGADLYVTLEPCDHQGKTPPCAPAVVAAGVARVFVGTIDPNPKVSGRGIERLRAAGIPVEVGVAEAECRELIEPWSKFIRTREPFVLCKVASTLDGRIATRTGDSRWITSEAARAEVHELRSVFDAVLVGKGTVQADDPRLTARVPGGRNPVRIVLDSRLEIAPEARVFSEEGRTLVACVGPHDGERAERLRRAGAEILACRPTPEGRVDLDDLLSRLGAMGIVSVLVEGGAGVFSSFLESGRVDRLLLYLGPKIFGDGPSWARAPVASTVEGALGFSLRSVRAVGADVRVELDAQKRESD
jgi:diaminohydroxyphosphoribosylaminopyrimidine deaminase/5-amino-6-(5-phosphoribosylamino)uracil reductase